MAAQARALIDGGTDPREIAVLVRTHAQPPPFERALRDAGVPYQVAGPSGFSIARRCGRRLA